MAVIHHVKLQLLRPGPAHNQLLSPLTPYIALCGTDGPVTLNLPFEHRQLLNRLTRLRYAEGGEEIPAQQREAEAREIGEILGGVLAEVPTLISELAGTCRRGALVHLRLSLSAFELGLVPFELAIGGDGFPASGSPLFLQSQLPIAVTREVRRSQPLSVPWNRPPKILFAFASPGGLPAVPSQSHLRALRRAIDPWVKWREDEEEQLAEVKKLLTVLPEASLKKIGDACAETPFTHIHLLAHGKEDMRAGDGYYGVALCHDTDPQRIAVVDGERLATVLTTKNPRLGTDHSPSVVSLATCDSGATHSVVSPGGSIAHALHAGGIPWVIASQFPLWMRASTTAAEILYRGMLGGDDPRWVLYELRQRLFTAYRETHDWASIVAYSSADEGFERQVEEFREGQRRERLNVLFDAADHYAAGNGLPPAYAATADLYRAIREEHAAWIAELDGDATPKLRAEALGMHAAAEKRIGLLCQTPDAEGGWQSGDATHEAFRKARDLYCQAMKSEPCNPWVTTQYLAMHAIVEETHSPDCLADEKGALWITARQCAEWQNTAADADAAMLGTLAELELLGALYHHGRDRNWSRQDAKAAIHGLCHRLLKKAGAESFAVLSTKRQFERYRDRWSWRHESWAELAGAAVEVLGRTAAC